MKGHLEIRHRQFAADAGEVVQKLVEAVPGREVLDEDLYGDARSGEDKRSVHDLRVA